MNKDKIIVIFSGYNNRAVISFIRTLEKNKIKYVIISKDNNDPILKSTYKNNVIIKREDQSLNLYLIKKYIEIIRKKHKTTHYFIAPSTEALNRFLQKNRSALESMNVIVPLSDPELYESVSDKKIFSDICHEYNILVPNEYDSINKTSFPFVAKPKKYFAKDGSIHAPFLVFDSKQKTAFLNSCNSDDFFFQEYIEGRSIYFLYYFHRNGNVYKYSQENLIQQPEGKSMIAAISSDFHKTDECKKYERLFKSIGFYGLVMVEIKVDNEKSYMIEANPRFWGPSQLFVDAGMNFFELFLHDYDFIKNAPAVNNIKESKYFWFGGVQKTLRENGKLFFSEIEEQQFLMDLDMWLHHDVFKRIDTIGIFKEEIK